MSHTVGLHTSPVLHVQDQSQTILYTEDSSKRKVEPALLEQLSPLPVPCTRLEVDLYRLLRCCERIARSRSAAELQADPKFHNYVAYLRELFAQLQQESGASSTGLSASRPNAAAAETSRAEAAREAYLERITLLADLLEEHMLPDMWHVPESLPIVNDLQWGDLIAPDRDLPSPSRGITSAQSQQQQKLEEAEAAAVGSAGVLSSARSPAAGLHSGADAAAASGRHAREALGLRSRRRQLRGRQHGSSSKGHQPSPLPGSSLDDASRAIITTHKDLHEELSGQMLTLAGQMKANASAMEQKVKSSNKVLDTTEEAMERNVANLSRANQKASKLARQGFCTGLWTWMAMAALLTMFIGMIMFIRMT